MRKNPPLRTKAVYDDHLIRREYYNAEKFEVIFELMPEKIPYVAGAGIALGPKRAVLKPGCWLVLPHAFYVITAANGAPFINLTVNMGDMIGTGNKLPSLPVLESR